MNGEHEQNDIPNAGWHMGHPVPDLERLPQERWAAALQQVPSAVRWHAARRFGPHRANEIVPLILEIDGEEQDRRKALRRAADYPPPLPGAQAPGPPARRRQRQISFRLGPSEHAAVIEAATALAMKPGALARLLTVRGAWQVIAEARSRG